MIRRQDRVLAVSQFYLGLDLGQSKDYTALAVIEKLPGADEELHVRHLERYPLGTSYPAVVESVGERLKHEAFKRTPPMLIVDATGCGAPVADMFRAARREARLWCDLRPVIITGGDTATREGDVNRVPKRDLVGVVQVGLQTGKLKIAPTLREARLLESELLNFQVKITAAANDVYGAWREGSHDDLVLAVALAAYAAHEWRPARHPAVGPPRSHSLVTWG